jgi:multidrug efflux system outer membrane protein
MMSKKILSIVTLLSFTGCTLMPGYHRPASPVSSMYRTISKEDASKSVQAAVDIGWREFFSEPRLQRLIEIALNNNRDLRVAALNVDLLRAQYRIGIAYLIPTISGTGSGTRQRDVLPDGEASTTGKYSLRVGVSAYELDLFGRVRSLKKQALEQYLASEEARRSVQISLVAQVAIQYLTERALAEQLIETKETLKSLEQYYQLIKSSYDVGSTSELDLRSSEAQVQTARVNVSNYERQHAQAENALALLLGQPIPDDLPSPQPFGSQTILTDIAEGVPSELLQRRPDILEAEHQLKAANANIGAARATFFPKITLTGSGGIASVSLADLFSGASVWSFAPQISIPIFGGGAKEATLDAAGISKSIEIAQYEKAIQTAFREVSDALIGRTTLDEQVDAQQALVKAQQQRYDLADVRYRNGVDSYLTVLTAQQELYNAQQNLIQTQFSRLSNLITLYKALGGGWGDRSRSFSQ